MAVISCYDFLIVDVTDKYIDSLEILDDLPPIELSINEIIKTSNDEIDMYNLGPRDESTSKDDPIKVQYPYQKQGSKRFKNLVNLEPYQVARLCILYFNFIKLYWDYDISDENSILLQNNDNFSLAVYRDDESVKGIYDTSDSAIFYYIRKISPLADTKQIKQIISHIETYAPVRFRNNDKDLVAVNNGIFDYKEKVLLDFDPKYVFLSKSRVDFNSDAKLINITMPDGEVWNIESWFETLSDDPEVVNSLWEITSAILRPCVDWNKAVFLLSPIGNNGKGTFCVLLRNLLGPNSSASIPITNFSKDFMLTPLMKANAVICDENDVGGYLENAGYFKLAVTKDPMRINIKNK